MKYIKNLIARSDINLDIYIFAWKKRFIAGGGGRFASCDASHNVHSRDLIKPEMPNAFVLRCATSVHTTYRSSALNRTRIDTRLRPTTKYLEPDYRNSRNQRLATFFCALPSTSLYISANIASYFSNMHDSPVRLSKHSLFNTEL